MYNRTFKMLILMSVVESVWADKLRNSIGNTTAYTSRGQVVLREKSKPKNPNTLKQQKQRLRMKTLVQLAKVFAEVLSIGFPNRNVRLTAENCFTGKNQLAVEVSDELEVTVVYEKLVLSEDTCPLPRQITVTPDAETGNLSFTIGEQRFFRHAAPDDQFYAVLLEKELQECEMVPLCKRGAPDMVEVPLPEGWDGSHLAVYVLVVASNGRRVSKSRYMKLE